MRNREKVIEKVLDMCNGDAMAAIGYVLEKPEEAEITLNIARAAFGAPGKKTLISILEQEVEVSD